MKNKVLLLIISLTCFFIKSEAQVYHGTYQQQQQQQHASEVYRTTAYTISLSGEIRKMPIKLQIVDQYTNTMKVVEKYVSNGIYGQWQKEYNSGEVRKCQPLLSNNPLEKEFMYKVTILTDTWYFDL